MCENPNHDSLLWNYQKPAFNYLIGNEITYGESSQVITRSHRTFDSSTPLPIRAPLSQRKNLGDLTLTNDTTITHSSFPPDFVRTNLDIRRSITKIVARPVKMQVRRRFRKALGGTVKLNWSIGATKVEFIDN